MTNVFVCIHCQKEYEDIFKNEIDNKLVCDDCKDELYVKCSDCEKLTLKETTKLTANNNLICEECFRAHYFSCQDCGDIHPLDNSRTGADDYPYCEHCFDELFRYCSSCENVVWQRDAYTDDNGDYYCSCCWEEHNNDDEDDYCDYSEITFNPPDKPTFIELPYTRTYGVELETSKNPDSYFEGVFKCVHDGSITGREYVSPILQGDEGLDTIRDFCTDANDNGLDVDRACGYHLHIGSKDISFRKLKNVLLVYKYFEPLIYSMIAPSRKDSNWCRSIGFNIQQIIKCQSEKELQILYYSFNNDVNKHHIKSYCKHKYQPQRYAGLNLHSHWFRSTIEIRYANGTINSTKVINWIKLHLTLIDYALKHKTATILKLFPNSDSLGELKNILTQSPLLDREKVYEYIVQRIEHFKPIQPMPVIEPEEMISEETLISEPELVMA